ncbi:MAG TPA: glycosyltransferase family 1 protein [Bacteroidia bacterium]|nr:glycosyltransferase family 1 protein [Bacteroidia bacterium]
MPYPANYGGVIDVFYKLVNLHRSGVKIILHCMEYGRGEQKELEKYCHKVYYYKRNTSFLNQLSSIPYIVKSRNSKELLANLLKDNYPILFEGLHTCYYLHNEKLKNRFKIYRESNIEHHYYYHLAHTETNGLKKLYFVTEAKKLYSFQKQLSCADLMLVVSTADQNYLQDEFPGKNIEYLPSFHPYNELKCKEGKGEYILYNGNLSVNENTRAVEFLVKNVFSKIKQQVIIAGLNPPEKMKEWVKPFSNIKIIANPDEAEMQQLLEDAHVHCLYTHQDTGLKLKLLNVLYSGRFCICNDLMLEGTTLHNCCMVKNTPEEIIQSIRQCFTSDFTNELKEERKQKLGPFDNVAKTARLVKFLP